MNIAEHNAKEIKSLRARELDELRKRGVAKSRRTKLKDLVASPLTTPEQAHQFLAAMRDKSKKEVWEHKPPSNLSSDGVDAWYMMQRHRDQEMRKRRLEAEQLLRGYRAPYKGDDGDYCWSPRRGRGRASFGDVPSESLVDPSDGERRRQSTMPRLEHNWGEDVSVGSSMHNMQRTPLKPERTQFLNQRHHYDGTQYGKPDDRMAYHNGHALFSEYGGAEFEDEQRDPASTSFIHRSQYIDTTESENRLREAGDMMNLDTRLGRASDVMDFDGLGGNIRFDVGSGREGPEEDRVKAPSGYADHKPVFADGAETPSGYTDNTPAFADGAETPSGYTDHTPAFTEGAETPSGYTDQTPAFTEAAPLVREKVPETVWRDFISPEPGAKFPPEAGRYHLYASYACPGSHRALIVRALKGLEDVLSVTIVHPTWRHTNLDDPNDKHRGWVFGDPKGKPFQNTTGRGGPFPAAYPGNDPDPILNAYSVRNLYEYAKDTSGKYTIPLLWDKKLNTIVNNESSDISYMLNSCFNEFSSDPKLDLYTEDDEEGLDKLNEVSQWLYPMMIHGVYRCGFAKTQKAYDRAIEELTAAFDMADELLQQQRYLTGDILTDADIRLFVTLLRFDEVYAFYFRANTRLVMLTPTLLNFCREIYQMHGVAETCQMQQIKAHFFGSHAEWNKYSVVPRGLGFMDLLDQPHDREVFEKR